MKSDHRNTALAVVVVALIIAALFFVPYRIELTGEISWSPLYRSPLEFQAFEAGGTESALITALDAHISWGWYLAEIGALSVVGWIVVQVASGFGKEE